MVLYHIDKPIIFEDSKKLSNEQIELIDKGEKTKQYFEQEEKSKTSISIPFMASNTSDKIINGFLELPKWLYIILIILVITATSNAINLTDGLDGLAAGLTAISVTALGVIAYASGRLDFSDYLNILYIRGSDELLIFSFATVGACLGFLWYNSCLLYTSPSPRDS